MYLKQNIQKTLINVFLVMFFKQNIVFKNVFFCSFLIESVLKDILTSIAKNKVKINITDSV